MLMDWGARDGATAAPWVLDHPKTLGFPGAVHFIVCAWGGTDPQAATAWSEKLPKGDLRKNAFNSVAEGYVRKDSPAAAVWMTKLTDDDDRHAAVRCVADFWSATAMAKSQEAITSWAEKLPPADLKIAAGWIVTNWSKKEPAKAKAWVEKLSLPEADKAEVLKKIK